MGQFYPLIEKVNATKSLWFLKSCCNNFCRREVFYAVSYTHLKYTFTIKDGKAIHVYLKLKNKTVYDGKMKNGKLNGDAYIKYSNGDKYEGNISKGQKTGQGTYTWKNGAYYDGKWKKDDMNGRGTYFYSSKEKGISLSGSFKNGVPNGKCTYTDSDYTDYDTKWSNGVCIKISE